MRLVRLTGISGSPIWISPRHVRWVRPSGSATMIGFDEEDTKSVKEEPDEVVTALNSRLDP